MAFATGGAVGGAVVVVGGVVVVVGDGRWSSACVVGTAVVVGAGVVVGSAGRAPRRGGVTVNASRRTPFSRFATTSVCGPALRFSVGPLTHVHVVRALLGTVSTRVEPPSTGVGELVARRARGDRPVGQHVGRGRPGR